MAFDENWDEYGEYLEKEEFRNAKSIKKIFTSRGIKAVFRWMLYIFLIAIFGIILFRLVTNGPTKSMTNLLKTNDLMSAYAENNNLVVFSQKLHHYYTDDGLFTLYDVRYIPETEEIQFTIRYNNSTVKALKTVYEDEADNISSTPFIFVLRDNNGNRYSAYAIKEFSRTVYQYARVSFKVEDLFVSSYKIVNENYPSPNPNNGAYIYKGIYDSVENGKMITELYFDTYYENDVDFSKQSFSKEIMVYSSSYELQNYNYGSQLKGSTDSSIKYVQVNDKNSKFDNN